LTAPRWRHEAQAQGRSIALDVVTDDEVSIMGSPAGLREAFMNLVLNAVDAISDSGSIVLRARTDGPRVVVSVTDSGLGMSAEVQARVFEPFFTTKGNQGTGLGLAQVFGLIKQHQGEIELKSAPGQGTTFELSFPAAPGNVTPAPAPPVSTPARANRLRILVVDDEPAIGSMVTRILRPLRHAVVTATSAEEALEHLAAEPFDLVLSDLGLGTGMSGWDLVARVVEQWPSVRLILATGWGAAIDPAEARARGVAAVLSKPYHPTDLTAAIASLDLEGQGPALAA
jgi:CheY-like chemotaxis protein/anti-sigma regulatory factor (Ser/Thr protein kinase)